VLRYQVSLRDSFVGEKGRGGAIRLFEKKPRRFAVGALVRVTKGPFEGMVGTAKVEIKRSTKVVNDFGILQ
jgi:transcription antitermination factor NusG